MIEILPICHREASTWFWVLEAAWTNEELFLIGVACGFGSEFGIAAKELSNIASSSHFTICIESVENLMLISSDGYFWIIHIYLMLLESWT
ncbi:hypothetical protein Anas_13926 [Armadillidium nasatum]|uniref:Uncharacterized protein n=1 Tax=Armadillidium nasatum TaxID=96803 RepID=A0A5N5SRT2_9CRUS|nr:hypothetical protein Anas_13926 [Armadillidium nasatum]